MSDVAFPPDLRVLVVEDEALVAINLEAILEDLGCQVVGPAMRFERAEALIEADKSAQAAILDVNLGGQPVYPLAERLVARGVPIVFATGYGKAGIPVEWHGCPIIQKPYTMADVRSGLLTALNGRI